MKRASPFVDSRTANFSIKKGELEDICSHQKGKASEPDKNNFMHSSEVQTELTGSQLADLRVEEQLQRVPTHLHMLYTQSIETLDEKQRCQLANLLLRYQETFAKTKSELGKCSVLKHHIDTAEAAPVDQPSRRTPQDFEGEEEKYLNEQLKVIRPSSSAWASPIIMVRKKTGDVRVCIDYSKLNERSIKDAYPLPRIDACLDCLLFDD